MKIDLHLHTITSSKNGDSINWESPYEALVALKNANVKMAAFTDHNDFNVEIYLKAREIAKDFICILPGIEVNVVKKDGKIGHMLILFPENLTDYQLNQIKNISKTILKNGISINEINDLFNEFPTIRIIHVGKEEYFTHTDLKNLNYDAFEITNFNHQNYLSILKHGYISSVVAFSDTHNWKRYPQQRNLITIIDDLENNNFDSLKICLSKNKIYAVINE